MENRYPLFAGGRILKKEALWDLRNYACGSMQFYYMDYTDGIVRGFDIHVEDHYLVVGKGELKYGDFLYLLRKEVRIPLNDYSLAAGVDMRAEKAQKIDDVPSIIKRIVAAKVSI